MDIENKLFWSIARHWTFYYWGRGLDFFK